jgi:hypothetical protein
MEDDTLSRRSPRPAVRSAATWRAAGATSMESHLAWSKVVFLAVVYGSVFLCGVFILYSVVETPRTVPRNLPRLIQGR